MKIFWIEYYFTSDPDRILTYVTDADSRKKAELKVREIETEPINIKHINCEFDSNKSLSPEEQTAILRNAVDHLNRNFKPEED